MPTADFTKPYNLISGTAVTKDVVVFANTGGTTTTALLQVNGNQVLNGNRSIAGDGAASARIVLHVGDVPTITSYLCHAFEIYK